MAIKIPKANARKALIFDFMQLLSFKIILTFSAVAIFVLLL